MKPELKSGVILVKKPDGPSSFFIVEKIRRMFRDTYGLKRRELPRVGHAGTLDPFATGLLVILVGSASKLSKYLLSSDKTYEGEIEFGLTSLSGDRTNDITERSDIKPASAKTIKSVAYQFCNTVYHQKPPMHSAVKVDGKRLYELARRGQEIKVESRPRKVFSFDILDYSGCKAQFRAKVSSGTYIRQLAKDLSLNLGTVGILNSLNRTASGTFSIEQAVELDDLEKLIASGMLYQSPAWVSLYSVVSEWNQAMITDDERNAIEHGNQSALFSVSKRLNGHQETAVLLNKQQLVATVAKTDAGLWKLDRVFAHTQ